MVNSIHKKREREAVEYGDSSADDLVHPALFSDLPCDEEFVKRQKTGGIKFREINGKKLRTNDIPLESPFGASVLESDGAKREYRMPERLFKICVVEGSTPDPLWLVCSLRATTDLTLPGYSHLSL